MIKIKNIPGLMIDKKYIEANTEIGIGEERIKSFNEALYQIGNCLLTLNREKLAKEIYQDVIFDGVIHVGIVNDRECKTIAYRIAEAIIAALPSLLEVGKE